MLITYARPSFVGRYTPKDGRHFFIAFSRIDEREQLKAAGFRWDRDMHLPDSPQRGYWYTAEAAIAARLGPYCDEAAAPLVKDLIASRKESRAIGSDVDIPRPDGLDYMPFQKAGIKYAMARTNTLFGDEMGLGKTIQAIGVINATQPPPMRVLVICPASLKTNWRRELARWLVDPLWSVGIVKPGDKFLPPARIVIINYDLMTKHTAALARTEWDVLIVDECHYVKNPEAQRSKAIFGGKNEEERKTYPGITAKQKLFLTGTPIVNRPMELFPLLHHLDPTRWKHKGDFAWRYTVKGEKNKGRNLEELQDILRSTVMVRRLKKDVMTELPPKRRQILELPASAEQRRALDAEMRAVRDHMTAAEPEALKMSDAGGTDSSWAAVVNQLMDGTFGSFEELSRLRRQTAVIKAPSVVDHVAELLEEIPKVVVFAHHIEVLDILEAGLKRFGSVRIDGSTPLPARQQYVDRFQNTDECRVFIGGIIPAGVGLTLTASNTVVFAELDWTPGNMKQAEDRCHRIGSEGHESILIQQVVLEESIDVEIAKLLVEKLETIEKAMDRETPQPPADVKAEAPARQEKPVDTRPTRPERTDADYPFLPGGIAQARAIKEGLGILAGLDPDRAGEINGVGFNKMDGDIGHSLARWEGDFTPRQAEMGRKVLRKYRRQLPVELYELACAFEESGVPASV